MSSCHPLRTAAGAAAVPIVPLNVNFLGAISARPLPTPVLAVLISYVTVARNRATEPTLALRDHPALSAAARLILQTSVVLPLIVNML